MCEAVTSVQTRFLASQNVWRTGPADTGFGGRKRGHTAQASEAPPTALSDPAPSDKAVSGACANRAGAPSGDYSPEASALQGFPKDPVRKLRYLAWASRQGGAEWTSIFTGRGHAQLGGASNKGWSRRPGTSSRAGLAQSLQPRVGSGPSGRSYLSWPTVMPGPIMPPAPSAALLLTCTPPGPLCGKSPAEPRGRPCVAPQEQRSLGLACREERGCGPERGPAVQGQAQSLVTEVAACYMVALQGEGWHSGGLDALGLQS